MTTDTIKLSATVPASPKRVFKAILSSRQHSEFINGQVKIEPRVGGKFHIEWPGSGWDGYIEGKILEFKPPVRMVWQWRSSVFPEQYGNSKVVMTLEGTPKGTRISIVHTDLPEASGDYFEHGWKTIYLEGLKDYFSGA